MRAGGRVEGVCDGGRRAVKVREGGRVGGRGSVGGEGRGWEVMKRSRRKKQGGNG